MILFSFSFVLREEGLELTIHLTPGIGGKPYKTLVFEDFTTDMSIAWGERKIKPCPN
jgi:hypothetical protein